MRRFIQDQKSGRQKGMSLILTTLMMVFVTSIVGLSVDAGSVYVIKSGVSAAADAAALAAGRSLNLGDTFTAVEASARASAVRYFKANMPSGYMNATYADSDITTSFVMQNDESGNPNGVLTITVNARVKAPTYFMRVLDYNTMDVVARGVATRRSLVLALILDRSGSMGNRQTATGTQPTAMGTEPCENMVYGALQFVDLFSPYDYVGVVSFASTPTLDFAVQSDFKRPGGIKDAIANIDCNGSTNTTGALFTAYQQIQAKNLRLAVNAIVLFTDGAPNGINFVAPLKRLVDNRYGVISSASPDPASPNNTTTNINNCRNRTDRICNGVPVRCPNSTAQPVGQLNSSQDPLGDRSTFQRSMPSDANGAWNLPSGCATGTNSTTTQSIAFIPPTDRWGNKTWGHNPPFKDNWVFEVNYKCAPNFVVMSPGAPSCRNIGDYFSNGYSSTGAGTNFFPAGHPYQNQLRPDTPNALRVAGMNSAMDMAATIRANSTYKIILSTIFLMNGTDAIERDFMPIISNQPMIPPLPYDYYAPAKENPYYQPNQQTGTHVPLTNRNDLVGAFMQIASSLLRISQ